MKKQSLPAKKVSKNSPVKKATTTTKKSAVQSNTLLYSLIAVVVIVIGVLGLMVANMTTSTDTRSQAAFKKNNYDKPREQRFLVSVGEVQADGRLGGWVIDTQNPNKELTVAAYIDGARDVSGKGGKHLATVKTTIKRPDLNERFKSTANHGFRFELPAQYKDGQDHKLFLYVVEGKGDGNVQDTAQTYKILSDSPFSFRWMVSGSTVN